MAQGFSGHNAGLTQLHVAIVVLAETADARDGILVGFRQSIDPCFAGLPCLIRRPAIKAGEHNGRLTNFFIIIFHTPILSKVSYLGNLTQYKNIPVQSFLYSALKGRRRPKAPPTSINHNQRENNHTNHNLTPPRATRCRPRPPLLPARDFRLCGLTISRAFLTLHGRPHNRQPFA